MTHHNCNLDDMHSGAASILAVFNPEPQRCFTRRQQAMIRLLRRLGTPLPYQPRVRWSTRSANNGR